MALQSQLIDPALFTTIRLLSGAVFLGLLSIYLQRLLANPKPVLQQGSWPSGFALFVYAAGFSFAYVQLDAGLGALVLFGSVQITMLTLSLLAGERFTKLQWLGFVAALIGLTWLLLPEGAIEVSRLTVSNASESTATSQVYSTLLMVAAGVAWGIYSLNGKAVTLPTYATAANFIRACVFTLLLSVCVFVFGSIDMLTESTQSALSLSLTTHGIVLAIISGVVTSGIGYAVWYAVLPFLKGTSAASLQLLVPVIATLAGSLLLQELITQKLVLSSLLILGGVALIIYSRTKKSQ